MNVSPRRVDTPLFHRLIVWMPLALTCCAVPGSHRSSAETDPRVRLVAAQPLAATPEDPEKKQNPDGTKITMEKRGDKYVTDVHAVTDYPITVTLSPSEGRTVALAYYDPMYPSQMYWKYETDDDGTFTVSAPTGKITSVEGRPIASSAYILLKHCSTSLVNLTVRDGGAGGSTKIGPLDMSSTSVPGAADGAKLIPQSGGAWTLEMVHDERKIELDVVYVP